MSSENQEEQLLNEESMTDSIENQMKLDNDEDSLLKIENIKLDENEVSITSQWDFCLKSDEDIISFPSQENMEKINQDENYLLKINPENTNTIDINQNQTKSNDITSKVSLQLEITDIFNELSELFSFAKPAVEAKKLYYNKKGSKRKSFYYKNLEKFSPEIRSLVTDGNIKCKCELSSKKNENGRKDNSICRVGTAEGSLNIESR